MGRRQQAPVQGGPRVCVRNPPCGHEGVSNPAWRKWVGGGGGGRFPNDGPPPAARQVLMQIAFFIPPIPGEGSTHKWGVVAAIAPRSGDCPQALRPGRRLKSSFLLPLPPLSKLINSYVFVSYKENKTYSAKEAGGNPVLAFATAVALATPRGPLPSFVAIQLSWRVARTD